MDTMTRLRGLLGLGEKRPIPVQERLSSKPMEQWTEDERAFMRLHERNKADSGPGAGEEQAERVENSILDTPPENWTDSQEALVQERAQKRAENDPLRKAFVEGREAERKAQPHIQDAPFSPGRLAEDFEGMLVDDLRSRDIPLQRHAPELQHLPGEKSAPSAASTPSPARRTSAGRAAPRADVKPLDSSMAVKAGESLLARLKSPGNGSVLPDSVRRFARRPQSEDDSGSGGSEGSPLRNIAIGRALDEAGAAFAKQKPSQVFDSLEAGVAREDKLKADKEQLAQQLAMKAQDLERRRQEAEDRLNRQTLSDEERARHNREMERLRAEGDKTTAELRRMGYSLQGQMVGLAKERLKDSREKGSAKDDVLTFTRWKLRDGRSVRPGEAEKFRKEDGASEQIDGTAGEMARILRDARGYQFLPGKTRADLGVLRQGLQYALKDTEGMGALQKAEIDRLNQMIEDPSTLENLLKSEAGYGEAVRRLEGVQRLYKARSATRADALGLDWIGEGEEPQAFGRSRGGGGQPRQQPQTKIHMRNDETGEEFDVDPADVADAERDGFRRAS